MNQNKKIKIIVIGFIFFSFLFVSISKANGATYYIDPTCSYNGNGTGQTCASGAGQAGAYNSWSAVTWVAGNTYSQKGGTTANETITVGATGTAGNPITINSYGTGKAILDGIRNVTSPWNEQLPDYPGTYYTTSLTNGPFYEDGVPLTYGRNVGIEFGNVFWESGYRNYYKPTSGVPADHTLQYTRQYGINLGSNSYITINGLIIKRYQKGITGAMSPGYTNNHITITNNDIDESVWGIDLFTSNVTSTGLTVSNNTFTYLQNSIELGAQNLSVNGDVGKFTRADISNNIISNCSQMKGTSNLWRTAGTNYGVDFTYTYWGWGAGTDIEGIGTQALNDSNIHDNTITGMCRGIVHYNGAYHDASNNNFYRNYINTVADGLQFATEAGAATFDNNKVYYNIIKGGVEDSGYTTAVFLSNSTNPGGLPNVLYNNTIINTGYTSIIAPQGEGFKNYIIKNNIIIATNPALFKWHFHAHSLSDDVFDRNLYYPNTTTQSGYPTKLWHDDSGIQNSKYYSFTEWQAFGNDVNSLPPSDPKMTNGSGTYSLLNDFPIQSSSPAINGGVDVGLTSDFAGNPIQELPDIGAYEYQGEEVVPQNYSITNFIILISNWLKTSTSSDLNVDNIVNTKDLGIMMSKWN